GSRTYDRTAEAFRAYLQTSGRAVFVASGNAPYYDPTNAGIETTESEVNAAYLRLFGVPAGKIYIEALSQDTEENAQFLPKALNQIAVKEGHPIKKLLLVTSPFHLARYRLHVETSLDSYEPSVEVFAIGARASRYWAETYFLIDAKSGYTRDGTMTVVLVEYLKIAFDLCAETRPSEVKKFADRR
ncbi:MAG TPA: YdcF family protein, partial [Capsulimonadaceae bacterium]|nr:YdcF family protein [Capsulimonadaceae bacterium]